MREMPSTMNLFDSSDRYRRDRHRRRPLPHRPPAPGYPLAPPYAYPPVAAPYGAPPIYPGQTNQHTQIQQSVYPPSQTINVPETETTDNLEQPGTSSVQSSPQNMPDENHQQSGYSFRPLAAPPEKNQEAIPSYTPDETQAGSYTIQPLLDPPPAPPPEAASGNSDAPVMINGKPAVFRPMNLGVESSEE